MQGRNAAGRARLDSTVVVIIMVRSRTTSGYNTFGLGGLDSSSGDDGSGERGGGIGREA